MTGFRVKVCAILDTWFSSQDLSKLLSLVEQHQATFVEAWDEFFNA
ncbi:hypothetical protein BLL52_1957 [Rhodoferax antarcticus ANT.BR]|uniref:Uncharacterized protein n=1 Tax=Rhodoferax antarcticus ANT.BR TaxID=1111071 RepID=A0A1Q8YCE7_9BURK|nr:hypothetical protein BLL52_1957 [Rhodoferax antarcticus ANT.BR]